ncbi:MAG: DUF2156 domain-containing protein [Bdellovibrionales bacterium]|nr:DUF2156 domain-containing protein [Bdellovibrionales bacterium]
MTVLRSYRLAHPTEADEALRWFQKSIFSDIPPYFLTHWKTGKRFFYAGDALIAYEETLQHLVVAGEPLVAAGSDASEVFQAFREFARRKKKKICGYYVGRQFTEPHFFKVPLGTSVRIPLQDFDLSSPDAKEVRRALRKGQQHDYTALPIYRKDRADQSRVFGLYRNWKRAKLPFHIRFLLSKPCANNPVESYEEWFVVEKNGECLAFCSLLPYLQDGELGFYVDHLMYDPKRDPHALSFLISFLIEILKEEGVSELNLGLSPFARVGRESLMARLFSLLYQVPFLYRPRGLHAFKKKFAGIEEKEFCFFQNKNNKWLGLADLAWVTLRNPEPR